MTGILSRYVALQFFRAVAGVFVAVFVLVGLVDYIESTRRAATIANVSAGLIAQVSFFRVPQLTEKVLPFAVLVGAMICYLTLSRRLELVVARAAGVSAWQFVAPTVIAALLLGAVGTTVYNPLASLLRERSTRLESTMSGMGFSALRQTNAGYYVRQRSDDGQSIINAATSSDSGLSLGGVTVFTFDADGRFKERIVARSARLEPQQWLLQGARVYATGSPPHDYETYPLATNLTAAQITQTLARPESVSFWQLPAQIEMAERAGLSTTGFSVQYQILLAQPFLLAAMVLFAASISLRFFRFGGVQWMILAGIGGGFLLYVIFKVTEDLGKAALLSPVSAAWVPVLAAGVTGLLTLLYLEDG